MKASDLLIEVREEASYKTNCYKARATMTYNRRVHQPPLYLGDFIATYACLQYQLKLTAKHTS